MAVGICYLLVLVGLSPRFTLVPQNPFRLAERQQKSSADSKWLNAQPLDSLLNCTLLSSCLPSDFRRCNISGHVRQLLFKFALAST